MRTTLCLILFILCGFTSAAQNDFDQYFEKRSLRIDFALSGNQQQQTAALQQLREEPVWAGPVKNLIDPFHYGGYYVNVFNKKSGKLIYSRGFNTLFEEWRTTEQARFETQSWTNSISIPYPKETIHLEIAARSKENNKFYPLLEIDIDPTSIFIDKSKLKNNPVTTIVQNGCDSEKVDIVFIGDGYSEKEQDKFLSDARRFTNALFETVPFDNHKQDFNVRAVSLISEESGTDISGKGIFKNTALNAGFYTFGIERYLTTQDMKSVRDAVWNVPCDAVFILVNTDIYGGGGMYNFYAIGSADNERTIQVFVHEFGHSFAGLADEYFTSDVAYEEFYNTSLEPWEPNITSLVNFESKWKDLLPARTPVPTPLNDRYKNGIGVFEGAGYMSKGLYRPHDHCMMRDLTDFCPVCCRSIVQMINFLCDKKSDQ